MIRNDEIKLDKQHGLCPEGSSFWCTYWRHPNEYNDNKRLPSAFIEALKPLFKKLTKEELLKRCLLGLTQNQNEAINGVFRSKCPKTKFCGVRKVQLTVSETVMHFNSGSASRAITLKNLGVAISSNMLTAVRKEDTIRINVAAKKITEYARMRRRNLRAQKKYKKQDIINYKAGSFGLSSAPEDITRIQSGSVVPILNDKKKQLLKRKKLTNVDIIEKNAADDKNRTKLPKCFDISCVSL